MIKIESIRTSGWEAAIRGMRNPKNSWGRSDSLFIGEDGDYYTIAGDTGPYNGEKTEVEIGPNDEKLMRQLASGGPVHGKYLRYIDVTMDVTAPFYWWKEFDTYKVGTVANSCSTMHKLMAKPFEAADFSFERMIGAEDCDYIHQKIGRAALTGCQRQAILTLWGNGEYTQETLAEIFGVPVSTAHNLIHSKQAYDSIVDFYHKLAEPLVDICNEIRDRYLAAEDENLKKALWYTLIQCLPSSYNQKRTVKLNYEVLRGMYLHRKNHKLDEWREFCRMIESLPYSFLITEPYNADPRVGAETREKLRKAVFLLKEKGATEAELEAMGLIV